MPDPPREIALPASDEDSPPEKKRNFAGTPAA